MVCMILRISIDVKRICISLLFYNDYFILFYFIFIRILIFSKAKPSRVNYRSLLDISDIPAFN